MKIDKYKKNLISARYSYLSISLVQLLVLLLVFFSFGENSIFYFGSLIYFFTGYFYTNTRRTYKDLIYFAPSVLIFLSIVLIHYTVKLSTGDNINLPNYLGFGLYSLIFTISFFLGWLLKVMIRNEDIKELVFYSILSILLIRASMFFGRPFYSSFSGVAVLLVSYHLFLKSKIGKTFIVLCLSLPFLFIFVFTSDIYEEQLEVFLFILLSISVSLLLLGFMGRRKIRNSCAVIILSIYFLLIGINTIFMMNWVEYLYTRNHKLTETEFSESFVDLQGQMNSNIYFKDKIVVLDLWTTSCTVCFEKFPEFEKFYNKNTQRGDMAIYAVGIPNRWQEQSDIESVIFKMDYDFPFIISENDFQHYKEKYNINGVPAIIVLNKSGEIVYNSSFNNNPLVFINNLQNIVDKISESD